MLRRLLVTGVVLLAATSASAVVRPVLYSGHLLQGTTPLAGRHHVSVSLYSTQFGGVPLYTRADSVDVVYGVFSVHLLADESVWNGSDRYVGVSVNGQAETARELVGWSPQAVYCPRPSPQLVFGPTASRTVNGDQWTKVDSVTVTVTAPGTALVNAMGIALWTGAVNPPSCRLTIDRFTPVDWLTHLTSRDTVPIALTRLEALTPGTYQYYVWALVPAIGQSYFVQVNRLQVLFTPN